MLVKAKVPPLLLTDWCGVEIGCGGGGHGSEHASAVGQRSQAPGNKGRHSGSNAEHTSREA